MVNKVVYSTARDGAGTWVRL